MPFIGILSGIDIMQKKKQQQSSSVRGAKTGSLASFVAGLTLCLLVCIIAGKDEVHRTPALKQGPAKSRFETTEPNGVVPFANRIAVADS